MKKIKYSKKAVLLSAWALVAVFGLNGCGPQDAATTNAEKENSNSRTQSLNDDAATAAKPESIYLYQGQPLHSWNIFFRDAESSEMLKGAHGALPNAKVSVRASNKDGQEDALTFTWKDSWSAGLSLEGGDPLDLRGYVAEGVLSLDLNVVELAKGGLSFKLQCGENCDRRVPFTEQAFAMMGEGWKNIRLPLRCFAHDDDDFSSVTLPFNLDVGGQGEISIANVAVVKNAQANASCPDYKTVSTTPGMLKEFWAREWWEPRHKEKLQRVQQGNVDLIMLGDSITHGWENEGKEVWEKYYAARSPLNIGFSGDRTENVLWRLQHGEVDGLSPKAVVLMIGTNNAGHRQENPEYIANGIEAILGELRTRMPEAKVLLLAIFPREENPDASLRVINDNTNSIIEKFADNQQVFFLDINHVFLDKDGKLSRDIMPDLLHPNENGYALWAEAMEPTLKQLMEE